MPEHSDTGSGTTLLRQPHPLSLDALPLKMPSADLVLTEPVEPVACSRICIVLASLGEPSVPCQCAMKNRRFPLGVLCEKIDITSMYGTEG